MPRINDLLSEYGTSLEEMRRMHTEMQPLIQAEFERAMLPKIYSYQEAKDLFGMELPEAGYMLKVTPDKTFEEGYRMSYIAPSGYEFGEGMVTTPEGQAMDWQSFEELIARQNFEAMIPQRTPEEIAALTYEAPWTEEDVQQMTGLLETQEEQYRQRMDEFAQAQAIFGKVFPQLEVNSVMQFADQHPESFLRILREKGKTDDVVTLLQRMFPGINDTAIDQIMTPLPEGSWFIPGTNILVDPLDFSYIKSGVPSVETFKEAYYQMKGWPNININTLPWTTPTEELQAVRDRETQMMDEYLKRYGAGNVARSEISGPVSFVLPATGKLINPERPDINPTDIIFDVATVVPGLGYISKAGHLIKNVVLASKLVRIAETSSAAGFTVAQSMILKEQWGELGAGGKGTLIGFTGLTAVGTALGLRSIMTPALRQRLKDAAKAIGAEAKELATSEVGAIQLPDRPAVKTPAKGGIIPESAPGGRTAAEAKFLDEISKLSPEDRQLYLREIQSNIQDLANQLTYRGMDKVALEEFLRTDPLLNKRITIGTIRGKLKKVTIDGVEQLVPASGRAGQPRVMTLGDYLWWRYSRHGELPETFAKSEANILAGYPKDHVWEPHMLNRQDRVKREYIMDRIAEETGVADMDEIIERLNESFDHRMQLRNFETDTTALSQELTGYQRQLELLQQYMPTEPQMAPSTSVQAGLAGIAPEGQQIKAFEEFATAPGTGGTRQPLITPETGAKPLPGQEAMPGMGEPPKPPGRPPTKVAGMPEPEPIPEPSPDAKALATTNVKMTNQQAERLYKLMDDYLTSEEPIAQRQAAEEMRREVMKEKFTSFEKRTQELIIKEGKGYEEALKQARAEAMSGTLPDIPTDMFSDLTNQMRDALFARIPVVFQGNAGKQLTAMRALQKLLSGQSVAFHEGKEYSEMVVLRELFGDRPKLLKKLETANKERKNLRDVIEGRFHETGQDPIPPDAEMAEYLRRLETGGRQAPLEAPGVPYGGKPTPEMPKANPLGEFPESLQSSMLDEPANILAVEKAKRGLLGELPPEWVAVPEDKKIIAEYLPKDVLGRVPQPVMAYVYRAAKEVGLTGVDLGNFMRANVASFDNSWIRQAAPLIPANPVDFVPAYLKSWKAMFSEAAAEASWAKITKDPLYQIYEQTGQDFLRPWKLQKGTAAWKSVEEFGFTRGSERFIPRLAEKLPWVKFSERAFITGVNEFTWALFKRYHRQMVKINEKIAAGEKVLKPGEAFNVSKEMKDFGNMLADFSGRANVGYIGKAAPVANSLFFSLRLNLGRIFTPRHLLSVNPRVRKEAWKNLSAFVTTTTGVLMLGKELELWDVELDSRSADFMTARIGNVRIDPWAGYKQFVVFFSRLFTDSGVSSVTGKEYDANFWTLVANLARTKLSPLAGLVSDMLSGDTFVGEEFDIASPKQWSERMLPFAIQDAIEAYMEDGLEGLAWGAPAAFLGMGVQTYTGDWNENYARLGQPKYEDNLFYDITEPVYDVQDFYSDTAKQFKGVDLSKLTEKKGYSKQVQAVVEADRIKDTLNEYPNQKLTSINSDPAKGNTYKEYFAQWQERQRIIESGDEERLKEFDQDERTRNANLGNFGYRQLQLLDEYYSLPLEEREEFLNNHPELTTNPRQQYLRDNPEENAKLAVWGQADVYTQRAYDLTMQMAVELDIPDKALREYLPPADLAKPNFDYLDAVAEFGSNSAEAMIIRAQNPKLTEWLKLEPVRTPIETLEINIKNRALNEQYKGYGDRESRWYIEDPDARETARKEFKENNPEWVDDQKRIEVYNHNGNKTILSEWVEHDQLQRQYGTSSPEAKLYLIDHPETFEWAIDNGLISDDGKGWNIPVLKINAQYRQQDEAYNAIQNDDPRVQAQMREDYLNANPEYRIARIERDGYNLGITTPYLLSEWTEYNQLPEYGYWRKRYLKEHPELFGEVTRLQKERGQSVWETIDPDTVPAEEYDQIYEQYKGLFDQYENVQGSAAQRQMQREQLFNDNPQFRDAWYAREAYKLLFPEEYIENYVEYYRIPEAGYAQERYLKEHPAFYVEIFKRKEWKDPIDFDRVPSVELERLINIYDHLPVAGKQREAYRKEHPELDEWLMKYRGLKPIGHVHKRTSESEMIERMESQKWQAEQIRRLIAMLR